MYHNKYASLQCFGQYMKVIFIHDNNARMLFSCSKDQRKLFSYSLLIVLNLSFQLTYPPMLNILYICSYIEIISLIAVSSKAQILKNALFNINESL